MISVFLQLYAYIALVVLLYMTIVFTIGRLLHRNDVADSAWGIGFIVASVMSLYLTDNFTETAVLATVLVVIWGARLSLHIALRNSKKSEDYRYKAMRQKWGTWFALRSYLNIFVTQGILLQIVVLPVLLITYFSEAGINVLTVVGLTGWLVGFVFESVGDAQLRRFKQAKNNRGKVLDTGLWRYSRHPNYFGEVTQWWSLAIMALAFPWGWLGLIGPALLTYLILRVSGVPLLEQKYDTDPKYRTYKEQTSMFIPWPPKQ
jgi:steroid 5-alpha reductase family enzyme